MVKEVKDNISKDKDGAVFAFLEGIIKSKLVTAALRRLQEILTLGEYQTEIEDVIENNMQFLLEIVHIYYVLLKNGISKSTKTVEELRMKVLKIKEKVGELTLLVRGFPEWSITFSNGENLKATPMFRYHFFGILKYILLYLQNYGVSD